MSRYVGELYRRRRWFIRNVTPRKLANLAMNGIEAASRRDCLVSMPSIVKIDISPLCNLHCPACIHAKDGPGSLARQRFTARQRMSVDQYRRIIEQVRDTAISISPYFMGDPLMHPDLEELCRITADAGINMHVSTNLSFRLTDERIAGLASCGITHLTVCVDGLTQGLYERTRVGGRIKLVMSNLERICGYKRDLGLASPEIEVQYIKYDHNLHELEQARRACSDLGVDQFSDLWGSTENWTVERPMGYEPRARSLFPRCLWPYTTLVVKYDGDVLPCCLHRIGEHYVDRGDSRPAGNLFEQDVRQVWNSKAFRMTRRLVNDPGLVDSLPVSRDNFCHGCGALFHNEAGFNGA